jgi:uncharacterized protein YjbI with pentapeptide repeats
MPWQQLADLPFARALTGHPGELADDEAYDGDHFDDLNLAGADGTGSHFLECALTRVALQDSRLDRAEFGDVWLHDCRLVSVSLARTTWRDVTFTSVALAGVEAFGSHLRRVTFDRCKLDGINFRDCDLIEVTFDNCVLRDVDFGEARLTKTSFPGSRLSGTRLVKVTLQQVDLRGAELGLVIDPAALGGAIVTSAQLQAMAPLLAESIGIIVSDE